MKKKLIFIALILTCLTVSFISCNKDGDNRGYIYGYGKTSFTGLYGDFIKFDDGTLVMITNSHVLQGVENNERVYAELYIEETMEEGSTYKYKGELAWLTIIPVSELLIVDSPAADTLGTDIFIESYENKTHMWTTENMLTVVCYIPVSNYENGIKLHSVELASYEPDNISNTSDTIHLELRHNAHKDTKFKTARLVKSFNINDIHRLEGLDSVVIAVKVPVLDEDLGSSNLQMKTFNTTYKWKKLGRANNSSMQATRPKREAFEIVSK